MKAYRMEIRALLHTGAVPNLMSWDLSEKPEFSLMATYLQVTVADGTVAQIIGCVQKIPITFVTMVVPRAS